MSKDTERNQIVADLDVIKGLKLLSINKARKILGVRTDTVKGLIRAGSMKSIEINGRMKIPLQNLIQYINDQSKIPSEEHADNGIISSEEIQNKIDSIIRKYLEE